MNKILIVEDSISQRLKLKHVLEQNEYSVIDFADAESALVEISREHPSLIISDVIMPGKNGYEFCKEIKSNPETKYIPVILLTSLNEPEDVIKGLESKTDNFITKPYDEEDLLTRVKYVLMNDQIRHNQRSSSIGIDIFFRGDRHTITSDRVQILDLLFSTFENSLKQNFELKEANKKLEQYSRELKDKNKKLKNLNEDKTKYLRIAAHDIRNPAQVIFHSYNILNEELRDCMNEEQKEIFDIIEDGAESILQLLNEILDSAVIESGKLTLNISEVDIIKLINHAINFNKSTSGKKNVTVNHVSKYDELLVQIDKVKIEQVLNNLISNALKYSEKETSVQIEVSKTDEDIVISVIDQGLGIPSDKQKSLFEPFYTAGVRTTGGERSTGLGLSIVKKIVEAHKGEIIFESEVGKGSEFHVILPLLQEDGVD